MSVIPSARQSPRIENGILYWYEGDTFELALELTLTDQDGESIDIAAGSTVTVSFRSRREETVKEFEFTGIENNTVTLEFDSAATALFPAGEYRYTIAYTAGERTTIGHDNTAVVE